MREPELAPFYLVGGTALALHLGHRLSVDLDLFRDDGFDTRTLAESLATLPEFTLLREAQNTLTLQVAGVKLDLISHQYPRLRAVRSEEGIRLLEIPDLAAMKLSAVARRGSRKDFYDIAALLPLHPLPELLGWFAEKFQRSEPMMVIRSLVYFDDAEDDAEVASRNGTEWDEVKACLTVAVAAL